MITKYYKTITPRVAKNRIAKLVEKSNKAWAEFYEIKKYADEDSYLYEHCLKIAVGYSDALDVMGIEKIKYLADKQVN